MSRMAPPLVLLSMLLWECACSVHAWDPVIDVVYPCENKDPLSEQDEREIQQKAKQICRYQLLPTPIASRLPPTESLSELIRCEDLDYLEQHPSLVQLSQFDRPGLYAALGHFSQCTVSVDAWAGQVDVTFEELRPRWDASILTPEVLTPDTPSRRLKALVL